MSLLTIAWKYLYGRLLASALTAVSVALGVSLILATFLLTRGIRAGFIAGTTDRRFRAFDARTGKELWQAELEADGHATPMTYRGKKSGQQYVVVAAGGGGFLRSLSSVLSDTLVAYALPK